MGCFRRCASVGICIVAADSAYLLGGAQAGCQRQSNRDVWKAMSQQVSSCAGRGVEVTYRKVRARTERRLFAEVAQRADGQLMADALGNLQADALAGEAVCLLALLEIPAREACEAPDAEVHCRGSRALAMARETRSCSQGPAP